MYRTVEVHSIPLYCLSELFSTIPSLTSSRSFGFMPIVLLFGSVASFLTVWCRVSVPLLPHGDHQSISVFYFLFKYQYQVTELQSRTCKLNEWWSTAGRRRRRCETAGSNQQTRIDRHTPCVEPPMKGGVSFRRRRRRLTALRGRVFTITGAALFAFSRLERSIIFQRSTANPSKIEAHLTYRCAALYV